MSNPSGAGDGHDHEEGLGHPVPMRILLGTWGALVALTVITVAATYVDLGELNIFIALGIAVVKTTFVALFFMHLRWDKPFHSIVFVSAALFVMLFISLALLDTTQYAGEKIPGYAPEIEAAAQTAAAAEGEPAAGEAAAAPAGAEAGAAAAEGATGSAATGSAVSPSPAAGH